ncbi:unnamed protein product, partial [Allacma fusca]
MYTPGVTSCTFDCLGVPKKTDICETQVLPKSTLSNSSKIWLLWRLLKPLLWAMFECYFVNSSSGPWSIKLIMGPVLLIYMLNAAKLVVYLCSAFIYCSEETTFIQTYLYNAFKFLLSVIISTASTRLWNSYRASALCIRFADCPEENSVFIHWMNNLTNVVCGVPTETSRNDDCRRWLAQLPLICLSIISIIIVYYVSQLGSNKFDDIPPGGGGCTCSKDGLAEETAVSKAVVSGTSKCNGEKVDSDVCKNRNQDVHRSNY